MKRCQVAPLIANIINRIESDRNARQILARLLCVRPVVDMVIEGHPLQVDTLFRSVLNDLQQAPNEVRQYASLIQNAGSELLASYASYLALVEAILRWSNTDSDLWRRFAHPFFSSASPRLLASLSDTTVRDARDRWRELLKSSDSIDALLSIHIACNLQRYSTLKQGETPENPGEFDTILAQWSLKCCSLFEGNRASSIIDTTLLTALKLFSEEGLRASVTTLRMLVLAHDILHAVSHEVRREWARTHSAVVRKLIQKISRPDAPTDVLVRNAAFNLLAILSPRHDFVEWLTLVRSTIRDLSEVHGDSLIHYAENSLSTSWRCLLHVMETNLPSATRASLPSLDSVIDVQPLIQLILARWDQGEDRCTNDVASTFAALVLVKALRPSDNLETMTVAELVVRGLIHADIPKYPSVTMDALTSQTRCSTVVVCLRSQELRRQALCKEMAELVLRFSSTRGIRLSASNFDAIHPHLVQAVPITQRQLCYYPQPMITQAKQPPTNSMPMSASRWRESLHAYLAGPMEQCVEVLERLVCDITHELQDRCENVESPLREVQMKAWQLETMLAPLQLDCNEMKGQLLEAQESLAQEEQAANRHKVLAQELSERSAALQDKYQRSQSRLEAVTQHLEMVRREHREQIDQVQREAQSDAAEKERARDLRASDYEDQIATLKDSVSTLQGQNEWLREEMKQCVSETELQWQERLSRLQEAYRNERARREADMGQLKSDLSAKDVENEHLGSQLSANEERIRQLSQLNVSLEAQAREAKQVIQSARSQIAAVEVEKQGEHDALTLLREKHAVSEVQVLQQAERIVKLEASETMWREKYRAHEKALSKARKAEERVLAILQRSSYSEPSPIPLREAATTMIATPTPRLPVGSFVSDDDEDYSELMELGNDL